MTAALLIATAAVTPFATEHNRTVVACWLIRCGLRLRGLS